MHRIFSILILAAVFVFAYFSVQKFLANLPPNVVTNYISQKSGCDEDCKRQIQEEVKRAIASSSASPTTQIIYQKAPISHQTQFISLDTDASTTNTGWTDVLGTDVAFDLAADYSKDAAVTWSAALKVENANGQAFVRLFDVTHGIAVSGSEVSVANNSSFQTITSGNLNLWSGKNTYRVQIKSLNSFKIYYTGGKIRISY